MAEILEMWPEPPEPMSPARQRLREASAALGQAQREAEDGAKPLQRLNQITVEASELERERDRLQSEDSTTLGRWIAEGGIGAPPGPSAATVATEQRLTEFQPAVRAVASALPSAQEAHRQSIARVQAAAAERSLAVAAVAVEAAAALAQQLTEALNGALAIEAKLLGLVEVFRSQPDDGGRAAEKIEHLIRTAKSSAAVPRDLASGRRLLDALAHNPDAEL